MAVGITDIVNVFSDFSGPIIREAWLPRIYDVAFDPKRSWFCSRIERSSEGIEGLDVKIPFLTALPSSWRGMTELGYTPSGGKLTSEDMEFSLQCSAASAMVSHKQLKGTKLRASKMKNLLDRQMQFLATTFPYYLRALLWTASGSYKAMGKAASISGNVVTLDNVGLWNTVAKDRAKLFEPGMVVQVYRSTAKVGEPVTVSAVNKGTGTVTLDSDPGVADNDTFVPADLGGLDVPYLTFPGILDVIDDDNTFQTVDRSAAANAWAKAIMKDATSETFGYELFSEFFYDCYNAPEAFTHPEVVRRYFKDEIRENVRFTPGGTYEDGHEFVQIDNTKLFGEDDCDRDKVIVPDLTNMKIADLGAMENLFDAGWQQIAGRPLVEYTVAWWALLYGIDCRKMGAMTAVPQAA